MIALNSATAANSPRCVSAKWATEELVRDAPPQDVTLKDLGAPSVARRSWQIIVLWV